MRDMAGLHIRFGQVRLLQIPDQSEEASTTSQLWQSIHDLLHTRIHAIAQVHEQAFASDQELLNAASDLGQQPGCSHEWTLGSLLCL